MSAEVNANYKKVKQIIGNLNQIKINDDENDKLSYAAKRLYKFISKSIQESKLEEELKEELETTIEEIELKYVITEEAPNTGGKKKIVYENVPMKDGAVKRVFAFTPEDMIKKNAEVKKAIKKITEEYDNKEVKFKTYFCPSDETRIKEVDEDVVEELIGFLFDKDAMKHFKKDTNVETVEVV